MNPAAAGAGPASGRCADWRSTPHHVEGPAIARDATRGRPLGRRGGSVGDVLRASRPQPQRPRRCRAQRVQETRTMISRSCNPGFRAIAEHVSESDADRNARFRYRDRRSETIASSIRHRCWRWPLDRSCPPEGGSQWPRTTPQPIHAWLRVQGRCAASRVTGRYAERLEVPHARVHADAADPERPTSRGAAPLVGAPTKSTKCRAFRTARSSVCARRTRRGDAWRACTFAERPAPAGGDIASGHGAGAGPTALDRDAAIRLAFGAAPPPTTLKSGRTCRSADRSDRGVKRRPPSSLCGLADEGQ